MRINEFNELHNICPADELLAYKRLDLGQPHRTVFIKELQDKISTQQRIVKRAERVAANQEGIIMELKKQIATMEARQKVLSQENAGLMNMLHEERESHEQSRLLMEKRIALASVRNEDKKPLAATQGVKNAYPGSYAERMRAKRF